MWFRLLGFRAHNILVLLVFAGACKKGSSPTAPPAAHAEPSLHDASVAVSHASVISSALAQVAPPPREVSKDSALRFTYVEPNGTFATTDNADKVPKAVRRLVRIMGRAKGEPRRRNNRNVEVIDVRELLATGKAQPRVMAREAFETGALAQLPPSASCALARPHGPPLPEDADEKGILGEPPIVVVYSAGWCATGKAARHYLFTNRVPFISKDIDNDPSAMSELRQKASRFGVTVDRVPILDVRGRLLVGYDEKRMDGLLADW
jgi:glutaredoxin